MRLRLLLIIMVIGLVLTRSRMGNSAFFAAMLIVGAMAIVLARKTAPQTIVLIASLVIIDVLVIGTWVGSGKSGRPHSRHRSPHCRRRCL
jgi:hypothetical protein